MEHGEGEADSQGTGGQKNTTPTTQDWKGTGPPIEVGRGGGQACGWWRHAEGGRNPRTVETLGLTGTWAQVEDVKEGATGRGKADTGSRKELRGPPRMGGKRR